MEANSQALPHGYVLQGKKNRYVIDKVLGQGAFGITYLARYKASIQGDIGVGSVWAQVAIKEFFMRDMNTRDGSTGYLNDASQDSLIGRYRRAFMREARNLAGLHHANIVNVFEVIETNNTVYIVMEYINGGSLDEHILKSGHLSEQESMDNMLKLCSAVGCMHEKRMLHLDIKPKNVMLDEDGELYLIDFGLSKQYTADGEPESSTSIGLGTPGYAPGEQAVHQDGDKRFQATLDIYALGATLYKMLTGKTPPNASQVSDSTLDGDNIIPKLLKELRVSDDLVDVVTKAMWPSSSKRYQSSAELVTAIDGVLQKQERENKEEKGNDGDGEGTVVELAAAAPTSASKPQTKELPKETPKTNQEPNLQPEASKKSKKGFPSWLYAVIAAIVVSLIVFLAMPKSKPLPVSTPKPTPEPVKEEIVTPITMPTPEEAKPEEPKMIALTSISLSKTSLTLEEGATSTLTVKYTPADATDKTTTWKSTDTKVATVNSSGKVTAVKAGSSAIIATCGGKEAYCNITVTAKATTTSANTGTGKSNGYEWVDLGLSVKWATCNVGANKPEDYGDYYAWGEISTQNDYSWSTYKYCNGSYDKLTKYCNDSDFGNNGFTDGKTKLDMSDDVARQRWGGGWRMPTEKEFQELIDNCTWTWTTQNGVNGYKVTGKKTGYTDRSIFLPAAGCRYDTSILSVGSYGYYWSSSLPTDYSDLAWYIGFVSSDVYAGYNDRFNGRSVRPVCP